MNCRLNQVKSRANRGSFNGRLGKGWSRGQILQSWNKEICIDLRKNNVDHKKWYTNPEHYERCERCANAVLSNAVILANQKTCYALSLKVNLSWTQSSLAAWSGPRKKSSVSSSVSFLHPSPTTNLSTSSKLPTWPSFQRPLHPCGFCPLKPATVFIRGPGDRGSFLISSNIVTYIIHS